MKNEMFTFAIIGSMAGIFLAGCGKTSEQKVEGAKKELKYAKAGYFAEWQKSGNAFSIRCSQVVFYFASSVAMISDLRIKKI